MKKVTLLVMNFTIGRTLTGVRPPKDHIPYVVVSCTKGKISFSPAAADLLNVGKGDSVEVVNAQDGEGKTVYAVAKVAKGSKLGGHLDFSAANAYLMLGGSKERNTYFTISTENTKVEGDTTYFGLTFSKVEPKAEKKAKATA